RRRRVGSARIWKASGMPIHYSYDICLVNDIFLPELAPDAHTEERRQLAEGPRRRANRPPPAFPARLPSLADHIESALRAVDGEIEAGDDALAVQQRHHEVPPALALGHVDLELEVESPEGQRPVAIADEVVEWREQRGPRLECARLNLVEQLEVVPVDVPVAFEPKVDRNDYPIGLELFPNGRKSLIAVPDEMALHLLLRGHAERA